MEVVPNPSADPTPSPRKRKAANSKPSSSADSTPSRGSEAGRAPGEPATQSTPPLQELKQVEVTVLIPCNASTSDTTRPIAQLTLYDERTNQDGARSRVVHSTRSVTLDYEECLANFIHPRYPNLSRVTIALHTPSNFIEYHEGIDEVLSYFMALMSEYCKFRIATKFTDAGDMPHEERKSLFKKANDYVYDELVALARPYRYEAEWVKVNGKRWGLTFDPYVVTWKRLSGWSERDVIGFLTEYAKEKKVKEAGPSTKGKKRRMDEPGESSASEGEMAPVETALERAARLVEQGAVAPIEGDPSVLEADDEYDSEDEDENVGQQPQQSRSSFLPGSSSKIRPPGDKFRASGKQVASPKQSSESQHAGTSKRFSRSPHAAT